MKPRTSNLSRACAALALACSLSSALLAQMEPTPTLTPTPAVASESSEGGSVAHSDKSFMKKANKSGLEEITISQAVLAHLSNNDLKNFAQQMVTDHTAANNGLMDLAQQKGVKLAQPDMSSLSDEWSKKTDNVDRAYAKKMVADHEDAVKLFEKASKSKDADVAAFAQKTLPTLQHHLMMAQDLEKQLM
jgi:putative membrane protein